jgi:hypothetical protein
VSFIIEVTKSPNEFYTILSWLVENTIGDWRTLDIDPVIETDWLAIMTRLKTCNKKRWAVKIKNIQQNYSDHLNYIEDFPSVGIFEFKNKQDAIMFKFKWGTRCSK